VVKTGSGLCLLTGFIISGVETSGTLPRLMYVDVWDTPC
jgi:hypothetical protein